MSAAAARCEDTERPLANIRVLSFTTGAAGPTCASCLAFFGAEVLHVESRMRPDGHRGGHNPEAWNKTPTFVKLHRNQKSITINLREAEGVALARELVRISDVVVENFSLGVLANWGLGYEDLRRIRPDVVAVGLRGFGSTGPYAGYASWGPNLGAFLGHSYLWNYAEGVAPTAEARVQHPDFMSGVCAAFAVMSALIHRARSGEGQWIDAGEIDVGAQPLGPAYLDYLVNGRDAHPQGNRTPGARHSGVYPCLGEDQWCAISAETDEQRRQLVESIAGGAEGGDQLDERIESWTQERTKLEVMEQLQARGIPAAAVQDVEEVLADPHLRARGFFVGLNEPEMGFVEAEGSPARLSETPGCYDEPAPLLGQHTEAVCVAHLGMDPVEVRRLMREQKLY